MFIFNYGNVVDPLLRDLRKYIPEFSGMKPGDRVLDVCCGTGAQVLEYGRQGIIATGIDLSPKMLEIASGNQVRQKAVNVSFILADATSLPFPVGHFDYASITFGLHDKEKAVRYKVVTEMKRVIKKEGALVFADFQVPLPRNKWALVTRIIEFLVHGSHYRGFKEYLASGGLDAIVIDNGLREVGRSEYLAGLLAVVKVVTG